MTRLRNLSSIVRHSELERNDSTKPQSIPEKKLNIENIKVDMSGQNFNPTPETICRLLNNSHKLINIIHNLENQLSKASDVAMAGKTMVAGLAHDLRNPLTVISSCAQFCLETDNVPEIIKEYLIMIHENVRKATNLVAQFLDFVNLEFKSININDLIQRIWETTLLETGASGIILEEELAKELPDICGNPDKIERIFNNLILNAIQAVLQNPTNRNVTIKSNHIQSKKMVEISIIDNGPGISSKIQSKIFTPFFTTKERGTGLGLHLSKHFIEQHKGKIIIKSRPRKGTAVTVKLPTEQNSIPF